MASGNFSACLAITLPHEGGYTNDRRDPGNWTGGKVGVGKLLGTKYGIAANTYPNLDIKNLTLAEAREIYRAAYWTPIKGEVLPFGIDLTGIDYSINSGPSRSVKDLQRAVGVKADGVVGPKTLSAIVASDIKATIRKHCALRLSFMRSLKIWKTYGKGWLRRVSDIEARAVAMYLARGQKLGNAERVVLQAESEKAAGKAATQTKTAGGTTAGGATIGGGDAVVTGEPNWLLIAGAVALVVVVAGALILRARHNRERAAAYALVASE